MSMFGDIKEQIDPVLDLLFLDEELARVILYRRFISESFDTELRRNIAVHEEIPGVAAIRMVHTARSAANAPGEVQAGQVLYMVRNGDLPDLDLLSLKDAIIDGTEQLPIAVINDIFGIVYELTVESGSLIQ